MTRRDGSFTFVVGGARSGKSSFAMRLGESMGTPRLYIATAEPLDAEMEERIRRHRDERGARWDTIEASRNVAAGVERAADYGVVLIDCLTLWLTNLLTDGLSDRAVVEKVEGLVAALKGAGTNVIAVSNEVGLGIVPPDPLSRRFRDLSGTMNQMVSGAATEAYFVASGMPLKLK